MTKLIRNQLLYELQLADDYLTAAELADLFAVSTKTIYREIRALNTDAPNGTVIESQRGRGYRLAGATPVTATPNMPVDTPTHRRRSLLIKPLLAAPKPLTYVELTPVFFVSKYTLRNDATAIKQDITRYQLTVHQKAAALAIAGSEEQIRRALFDVSIDSGEGLFEDTVDSSTQRRFLTVTEDVLQVIEQIVDAEVPEPYRTNLRSHLFIMISRARTSSDTYSTDTTRPEDADPAVWAVAQRVYDDVVGRTGLPIARHEIHYLYRYISSARINGPADIGVSDEDPVAHQVTDRYVQLVSTGLGMEVDSGTLWVDLFKHIKPMLNRLRHGVTIGHSIVEEIQSEYGQVYTAVNAASATISQTFHLREIGRSENAYITLYFARELEYQAPNLPVAIMCASGIGVGELLRAKMERLFPYLDVLGVYGLSEYPEGMPAETRLIISSVLPAEVVCDSPQVVLIDAMFTDASQRRVHDAVRRVHRD